MFASAYIYMKCSFIRLFLSSQQLTVDQQKMNTHIWRQPLYSINVCLSRVSNHYFLPFRLIYIVLFFSVYFIISLSFHFILLACQYHSVSLHVPLNLLSCFCSTSYFFFILLNVCTLLLLLLFYVEKRYISVYKIFCETTSPLQTFFLSKLLFNNANPPILFLLNHNVTQNIWKTTFLFISSNSFYHWLWRKHECAYTYIYLVYICVCVIVYVYSKLSNVQHQSARKIFKFFFVKTKTNNKWKKSFTILHND